MKESIRKRERLHSLDVVRGVATCLVLIRHLPPTERTGASFFEPLFLWLHEIGWIGVDLFFLLSGLLISSLIYREFDETSRFAPVRFLIRRSFKIWPTYFIAYGGVTILRLIVTHFRGDVENFRRIFTGAFWSSIFLQNYVRCEPWQHSWSIAIEEHFYTGLALLVAFSATLGRSTSGLKLFRFVGPIWLIAAFGSLWSRWQVSFPTANWHAAYYPTHHRLDALLFGVFLGYVVWYLPETLRTIPRNSTAIGGCFLAFLWPTIWPLHSSSYITSIGFPLIYLSFAPVVVAAAISNSPRPTHSCSWISHAFAWIGKYSYTIYIAHSVLFMIPGVESIRQRCLAMGEAVGGNELCVWVDRFGFWGASILLGFAMSVVIEQPFLKMRSRIIKSS